MYVPTDFYGALQPAVSFVLITHTLLIATRSKALMGWIVCNLCMI